MKNLINTAFLVIGLMLGITLGWMLNNFTCETSATAVEAPVEDSEITGWQLLQMAIIMTESNFNPQAIGRHKDVGIYQITPVYVREVNRILDTTLFNHTDAFDVRKSVEMFNIVQEKHNPEHDIEAAINLHNPEGDSIGYADKVLKNFRYLSQMEEIRKEITK